MVTEEQKEGEEEGRAGSSRRTDAHMWVPHDIPMAYLSTEIKKVEEDDKESLVKPMDKLKRSASFARVKGWKESGHSSNRTAV